MNKFYHPVKRIFFFLFLLALTLVVQAQPAFNPDSLREGDLLFVCELKGNAITKVTRGINGNTIDHVGITIFKNGKWLVLEAVHGGVVLTPLKNFICNNTPPHCNPPILHGRITGDVDLAASVRNTMSYLGRPYDFYFMPDDTKIYCSELVQKSYIDHLGHLIFRPVPMSFHTPKGHILRYWKRYYRLVGMAVPEGKPGSNPGELSRDKRVRIF